MEKTANDDRINPGVLALAIFASVLWTDAATKLWAQEALTEPVHINSWLCLALQRNTAIFFGAVPVSEVSVALWLFLARPWWAWGGAWCAPAAWPSAPAMVW